MASIKGLFEFARFLIARPRHRLRRLHRAIQGFRESRGLSLRTIINAVRKCFRVFAREGVQGLRERLSRYASPSEITPAPPAPLRRDRSSLGRILALDIYGETSGSERAKAVLNGARPLVSMAKQKRGLSVMILSKDRPEFIVPLLEQLLLEKTPFVDRGLELEILVGDTGSTNPDVLKFYDQLGNQVRVVRDMAYQFSRCNNDLATRAKGEVFLFLNNDIILPSPSGMLYRAFERYGSSPRHGAFGFAMHYAEGQKVQHMGMEFLIDPSLRGLPYHVNHRVELPPDAIPIEADYPAVTGASLMVGRQKFFDVGGFNPAFERECQDVALCLDLLRLGYENVCLNLGKMIHVENGTRPVGEEHWSDRRTFLRKYGSYIESLLSEVHAGRSCKSRLNEANGVAA